MEPAGQDQNNNNNNNAVQNNGQALNEFQPRSDPELGTLHVSNYAVTVNTNRQPRNFHEQIDHSDRLMNAIQSTFTDMGNLSTFAEFTYVGPDIGAILDNPLPPPLLDRRSVPMVSVMGQPELGPNNGRLHVHARVRIDHYGLLRIDPRRFNDVLRNNMELFGLPRECWARVRFIPDRNAAWNIYINKNPFAEHRQPADPNQPIYNAVNQLERAGVDLDADIYERD